MKKRFVNKMLYSVIIAQFNNYNDKYDGLGSFDSFKIDIAVNDFDDALAFAGAEVKRLTGSFEKFKFKVISVTFVGPVQV